ncbi:MAG TPA: hemerythrin domain-containing protein [Polyangiaceae bacterium]|jgi:hypothetical protein
MNREITSNRTDFYTSVHKSQRAEIGALIARAGSADPEDRGEIAAVAGAVTGLVVELRAHAEHEETFIHPLYRRCAPEVLAELEAGDGALDRLLGDLDERWRTVASDPTTTSAREAYRALARLAGRYFEHLEEEEATQPVLWERLPESELAAAMAAFRASRSAEEGVRGLLGMFPALHAGEQASILAGMRAGAPPAVYAATLGRVKGVLSQRAWTGLRARLVGAGLGHAERGEGRTTAF